MSWSVAGVVREWARTDPDSVMIQTTDETITAAELDERTNRVAHALLDTGVTAGNRVGFVGRNEVAWYELLFGAAKIGAVPVGLNWRLAPQELAAVAADAEVRLVATGRGLVDQTKVALSGLDLAPAIVSSEGWGVWRDRHPPGDPGHLPRPSDDALQLYTSGTTGMAKGVVLSHGALEATLPAAARWRLHPGATALVNLPLFHFGGTGWPIWALALGATCVLHPDVDAALTVEAFRDQVTTCLAVPQILRLLCDEADRTGGPFPALQCIGYGSAPSTEDLLIRVIDTFDCELVQTYGMTETCGILTQLGPDEHDPTGPRRHLLRSAGRPVPGVEVRVGGASVAQEVPLGSVGDVFVRTPWTMTGYWHRPEASEEVLTDGWLATGDMGFIDAEGYLHLTDRATDMIISGGENIYPGEVEAVLARHPAVSDVAALGLPDDRWGETVVAVVVPVSGTAPAPAELVSYSRQHLAHYKCPTRVVVTDALPRNATGKVVRRDLRELFAGHS